ncbi:MAG: aminotransferase class I/II-fold pyridoxal phosphate-dependent enzyme [Candidatus Marinimicrobia bacterium]|nr:aminotransferase class I/II-fold pyridoxal phosphate-dependent enzyme [Candidatus Neomarinimicrobiota bacterium]
MIPIKPANRVENIKYAIREVVVLANEIKATGKKMHYLNIGDPNKYDFITPKHMTDAVADAMQANLNGYSPSSGIEEARDAIKKQAEKSGIKNIKDIIITTGASEGIEMALTGLCNSGDNILLPFPSYPLYSAILGKLEAEVKPYYLNENDNWNLDIENIEKQIDKKTKGIVIINPNNPTGAIYPKETLLEIIELAKKHNLVIFSDEIYDKIILDDTKYTSLGSLTDEVPIITFNGLAKSYLVPGFRIGWSIFSGPNELIGEYVAGINKMARARLCANHPMQYAIKPALEGPQNHLSEMIEKLRIRRDLTVSMLTDLDEISCTTPQGAFYAFPSLHIPENDEKFVADLIKETGVVTVHGTGFGQKPNSKHLRIVFLPNEKILEEAYGKIRDFIKKRYH